MAEKHDVHIASAVLPAYSLLRQPAKAVAKVPAQHRKAQYRQTKPHAIPEIYRTALRVCDKAYDAWYPRYIDSPVQSGVHAALQQLFDFACGSFIQNDCHIRMQLKNGYRKIFTDRSEKRSFHCLCLLFSTHQEDNTFRSHDCFRPHGNIMIRNTCCIVAM